MKRHRKQGISYDERYRYKLNMLEPGLMMAKLIALLTGGGLALGLLRWYLLSVICLALAGAVFAALLALVAFEQHQDKVLNAIAMRENAEAEGRR